jgi:glutathione synthase/RimK-type ligase-like ATP-grasp enzyme
MSPIALVTYSAAPQLTPDDRLLRTALEEAGAEVQPVVWDEPRQWDEFDLVVLRSTWDYFLRPDEFATWLARLEDAGAEVLNPLATVRWNGDKKYLLDLEGRGVRIVPTAYVAQGDDATGLTTMLRSRGWTDAVVKPAISGGAHHTWRTSPGGGDDERFAELVRSQPGGMLVQPFIPEVISDGELSLIFLDGVFSHAAIKRPKVGDFRVQQEHGGLYAPAAPSRDVIAQAQNVVAAAAELTGVMATDFAYARVDGIVRSSPSGADFILMELECIEPSLFFLQHPPAAARMARSLLARLESRAGA